jgi:hypothetical protein
MNAVNKTSRDFARMTLAVDNRALHGNTPVAAPQTAPAGMTPAEAITMLERMGEIDIRMGVNGIRPTGYRSAMPQYISEYKDKLDWNDMPLRLAWPEPREIIWAEKVSDLITQHIHNETSRRIVRARSLVHPLTGKHLQSWERIGALLGMTKSGVLYRFERTIEKWSQVIQEPSQ